MWAYRVSPVQHMMETQSQFAPVLLPQFSQEQPEAPNQQQQMQPHFSWAVLLSHDNCYRNGMTPDNLGSSETQTCTHTRTHTRTNLACKHGTVHLHLQSVQTTHCKWELGSVSLAWHKRWGQITSHHVSVPKSEAKYWYLSETFYVTNTADCSRICCVLWTNTCTLTDRVIRNTKQTVPVPSRHFSSSSLLKTYYLAVTDSSRRKKRLFPTQMIRLMNLAAVKGSYKF